MRFTHWLTNTIVISRMTAVSGDKTAFSTVTSTNAQLQPLDAERTAIAGGVFGKTYRIWVDSSITINEGDKITDEDGNTYKVRLGGVTTRSMGSIDYKEILIEKTL